MFARESGILETREGAVSYERGDALLSGSKGESWPVERAFFLKTYLPVSGEVDPGQDGEYRGRDIPALAIQIGEPFIVEFSRHRGVLRGEAGDWLLRYAEDVYGIVGREIFKATYTVI